jgi:uncharacterized membrane protein YecN with MAPEG domain
VQSRAAAVPGWRRAGHTGALGLNNKEAAVSMHITMLYAGILAVVYLALSVQTIRTRARTKVNLGDGGNADMQRIMRGHGNFAEYVPMVLILMALLEGSGAAPGLVHTVGLILLVGRLFHAYTFAMTDKFFAGRVAGASLTLLSLAVAGIACLVRVV